MCAEFKGRYLSSEEGKEAKAALSCESDHSRSASGRKTRIAEHKWRNVVNQMSKNVKKRKLSQRGQKQSAYVDDEDDDDHDDYDDDREEDSSNGEEKEDVDALIQGYDVQDDNMLEEDISEAKTYIVVKKRAQQDDGGHGDGLDQGPIRKRRSWRAMRRALRPCKKRLIYSGLRVAA